MHCRHLVHPPHTVCSVELRSSVGAELCLEARDMGGSLLLVSIFKSTRGNIFDESVLGLSHSSILAQTLGIASLGFVVLMA